MLIFATGTPSGSSRGIGFSPTRYRKIKIGLHPEVMTKDQSAEGLKESRADMNTSALHPDRLPGLLSFLLACLLLAGCSKNAGEDAGNSDTNGYVCQKCNLKFYTERKVFAEFCPNCKDAFIRPVVGYVCEKDQHVTLTASAHGAVACEQCQASLSASKLPRESEFVAWGAVKRVGLKSQEVSRGALSCPSGPRLDCTGRLFLPDPTPRIWKSRFEVRVVLLAHESCLAEARSITTYNPRNNDTP